jgi:hypothetical protein
MRPIKITIALMMLLLLSFLSTAQEKSEFKNSAANFLAQAIDTLDSQAAMEKFHQIKSDTKSYFFDEREFNRLGYRLLNQYKIAEAIAVLKLNTELYPDSWNVWDSLGESYIYADNKKLAVQSYKKSLELNPQNQNGFWTLRRIDSELAQRRLETKVPFKYKPGEQTGLQGEYLGQKPPGLKPEVFAPGIVSTRGGHEFSCTFSPDSREFYFNRGPDIFVCRWEKEGWTAPEPVPFNSRYLDHEPHITADGKTLFFGSGRPQPGSEEPAYGIWAIQKTANGWSEPSFQFVGMYVTTAKNGTVYVTDWQGEEGDYIVRRKFAGNKYQAPEKLVGEVNTGGTAAHPCIAPDESFLIFDSKRPVAIGGEYDDDFYLCFRQPDGTWGKAIHFDAISTEGSNICAYLSPDGEYLFFYANHDIYWVSAEVIKQVVR